ncbi:nucleotide-diphospho-sugar transferase [Rhizoctonia solani]|nr:nucleotide-diphospho-sugar transferase [Rhizoctonia solani]
MPNEVSRKSGGQKAWVSLTTDKTYVAGLLVLLSSLKHHGTKYPMVVMVNPLRKDDPTERLPQEYRDILTSAGIILREVDYLIPQGGGYMGVEARFIDSWSKLRAFGLSEYERVVLIDSDMLVRKNMDELFDLPLEKGWIAASHACTCNPMRIPHYPPYWIPTTCGHTHAKPAEPGPDALCTAFQPEPESVITLHSINSGIVVLEPSDELSDEVIHGLHTDPQVTKYGFPDQDFLSNHFKNRIKFLGYEYNALKPMRKCHSATWRDENVRNVHYIFKDKPWVLPEGTSELDEQFHVVHGWWWDEWRRLEAEKKGEKWWRRVVDLTAVGTGSKGLTA